MKYFLIVSFLLLTSCASGPKFKKSSPKKDQALVYVYRINKFYGGMYSHNFYINGREVFSLDKAEYYPVYLSPGVHEIEVKKFGPIAKVQFKVLPGKTYYLREEPLEGERDKDVNAALHGAMAGTIISRFADSEIKSYQDVEKTGVRTSAFNPRLFFIKPEFGEVEIKEATLAK